MSDGNRCTPDPPDHDVGSRLEAEVPQRPLRAPIKLIHAVKMQVICQRLNLCIEKRLGRTDCPQGALLRSHELRVDVGYHLLDGALSSLTRKSVVDRVATLFDWYPPQGCDSDLLTGRVQHSQAENAVNHQGGNPPCKADIGICAMNDRDGAIAGAALAMFTPILSWVTCSVNWLYQSVCAVCWNFWEFLLP